MGFNSEFKGLNSHLLKCPIAVYGSVTSCFLGRVALEQKEDPPVKTTLFLGFSIATLHTEQYSHLPLLFK